MSKESESFAKNQPDMQLETRLANGNDNAATIAAVRQTLKAVLSDMLSWKRFYPQLASLPDTTEECTSHGIITTIELVNQGDGCDRTSAMLSFSNTNAETSDRHFRDHVFDRGTAVACSIEAEICVLHVRQLETDVLARFQHFQQPPWVVFCQMLRYQNANAPQDGFGNRGGVTGAAPSPQEAFQVGHYYCAVRFNVDCHPSARAFRLHMEQIIGGRVSDLMEYQLGMRRQDMTMARRASADNHRALDSMSGSSDAQSGSSSSYPSSSFPSSSSCSYSSSEEEEMRVCA